MSNERPELSNLLNRKLIFVSGKGGVGKTTVSQGLGLFLSQRDYRTLWVTFEDPNLPFEGLQKKNDNLFYLNCQATDAFEEYVSLLIGFKILAWLFTHNRLIQYLAKAAPGIHEIVLLGKVWFEKQEFDRVIVDMPSTGYGIAMFQSLKNFTHLFSGGLVKRDTERMMDTFSNPDETGHLIISLPEEMPIQEALELDGHLEQLFPENPAGLLVNRCFPEIESVPESDPESWPSPLAKDAKEYVEKRYQLEHHHLKKLSLKKTNFDTIEVIPKQDGIIESMAEVLHNKGIL